jgi:hypothetical protein
VSLPAADDLFRPTTTDPDGERGDEHERGGATGKPLVAAVPDSSAPEAAAGNRGRRPSGRVRHDEKMTVYVTADELLDLEHARLALRRDHGIAVDRGRLVREALAIVLADLERHGGGSDLVKRLEA